MNKLIIFVLLLLSFANAQMTDPGTTDDAKLDTLLQNQKKMLAMQEQVIKDLKLDEPLLGKHFGVEIDPVMLLFFDENVFVAGTFSLFNIDKKNEIAFPFLYQASVDVDYSEFIMDVRYRYFLGKHTNGFYVSAIGRVAYLSGVVYDDDYYYNYDDSMQDTDSQLKLGIGFGIGYRIFSKGGFYWGTSLSVGRYFSEEMDFNADVLFPNDSKVFFDFEILKIGYAF